MNPISKPNLKPLFLPCIQKLVKNGLTNTISLSLTHTLTLVVKNAEKIPLEVILFKIVGFPLSKQAKKNSHMCYKIMLKMSMIIFEPNK
jgi:hypothetical protein